MQRTDQRASCSAGPENHKRRRHRARLEDSEHLVLLGVESTDVLNEIPQKTPTKFVGNGRNRDDDLTSTTVSTIDDNTDIRTGAPPSLIFSGTFFATKPRAATSREDSSSCQCT